MAEPLIELKGVSKSFGQNPILDRVDLRIYRGEALAIIGPSGTGKSTILRISAGLLAPDAGEVFVQGQRRVGWVDDVADPLGSGVGGRREAVFGAMMGAAQGGWLADGADPIGIGMVFQQAALFDSLTVEENVGFLLYQHSKLPRRRIRELVEEKLEMVGLPRIGERYPAQLSGGMRKRVSFARAIMANPDNARDNPEVLLYDEPTAGLDPIASTVIEDLIRDLQAAQGVCSTYAIVTHQDSTIRRTADRIVFLYRGKVQWEGTVSDIASTDNLLIKQFFSGSVTGPIQVIG